MSSNVVPIITLRQVLGVDNTAVWTASQMLNKLLWEEWMFDSNQIGDLFSFLKALVKNKCIALEIMSIVRKWQETEEDAQSLVLLARRLSICDRLEHFPEMWSLALLTDDIIKSSN